jgi:hypothetical protein
MRLLKFSIYFTILVTSILLISYYEKDLINCKVFAGKCNCENSSCKILKKSV